MTENHRPSHLSTADVAQDQAEESTFGPDQEMEQKVEHFHPGGQAYAAVRSEDTDASCLAGLLFRRSSARIWML